MYRRSRAFSASTTSSAGSPIQPAPIVVNDRLPSDGHHGRKFIAFGPDGKLYVNVGVPCNVCEADPDRYGIIARMNADGSGLEVYTRGCATASDSTGTRRRKSSGSPTTGATISAMTCRRIRSTTLRAPDCDSAFPIVTAERLRTRSSGASTRARRSSRRRRSWVRMSPALGMRFYTGSQFPAAYRRRVFIAEHGSWNRSAKIGYRVTMVTLDGGKATGYEPFAEGWLQGQSAWGRPADVLVAPDGSLLVSDDMAGAIYRIRYKGS
jgi:glucose/arabinose dehydrogenase